MSGGGEIVVPQDLRYAAQIPERALHPMHEGLEGLAEGEAHPPPSAEHQHELEQQVAEGLPGEIGRAHV